MKTQYIILSKILVAFLVVIACNLSLVAQEGSVEQTNTSNVSLDFAPQQIHQTNKTILSPDFTGGSIAYGNDIWSNELYMLDTDDPTSPTVVDEFEILSVSGDFHPDDSTHIYLIDINDSFLKKVDVSTAETIDEVSLPVPIENGIWTVLAIHKTSGNFYGVATNGSESEIFEIDPATGISTSVMASGLSAVISGTFDNFGKLWLFEISGDSIYKVNLESKKVQTVGYAGFNGDFAQGMAYDVVNNAIYLAAYQSTVGPQLRLLDQTTGLTTLITSLPGSTTGFGFPYRDLSVEQYIEIPEGWSGISSFVEAQNPELEDLVNPIINQFVLMQNGENLFFWPQEQLFTLDTWDFTQGYMVFMNEATTLPITGYLQINPGISIKEGWNIIPVPFWDPYPVDQLFEGFDGLVILKEVAGTGVYWPQHSINTIGDLIPGKAYFVYSLEQGEISLEESK